MRRFIREAVYWIVAAAGLWALVMFLTWDFRVLTGMVMVNMPREKWRPHEIGPGVTAEELLLHVGLMAIWYFTHRWWRTGKEVS